MRHNDFNEFLHDARSICLRKVDYTVLEFRVYTSGLAPLMVNVEPLVKKKRKLYWGF